MSRNRPLSKLWIPVADGWRCGPGTLVEVPSCGVEAVVVGEKMEGAAEGGARVEGGMGHRERAMAWMPWKVPARMR